MQICDMSPSYTAISKTLNIFQDLIPLVDFILCIFGYNIFELKDSNTNEALQQSVDYKMVKFL